MTPGDLLAQVVADLAERSQPPSSEYEVVKAAALLRQLLHDGTSLVHRVNQAHKLTIKYEVNDQGPLVPIVPGNTVTFWAAQDGLDLTTTHEVGTVQSLPLKAFLRWGVLFVNDRWFSVHDVIDLVAHVEGGVHHGTPKTVDEQVLPGSTPRLSSATRAA